MASQEIKPIPPSVPDTLKESSGVPKPLPSPSQSDADPTTKPQMTKAPVRIDTDTGPPKWSLCNPSRHSIERGTTNALTRTPKGDICILLISLIWLALFGTICSIIGSHKTKATVHDKIEEIKILIEKGNPGNESYSDHLGHINITKLNYTIRGMHDTFDYVVYLTLVETVLNGIIFGYSIVAIAFAFVFHKKYSLFTGNQMKFKKCIIWISIRVPFVILIPTHIVYLVIIGDELISVAHYRKQLPLKDLLKESKATKAKIEDKFLLINLIADICVPVFVIMSQLWLIKWVHDIWATWMVSAYAYYQKKIHQTVRVSKGQGELHPKPQEPLTSNCLV